MSKMTWRIFTKLYPRHRVLLQRNLLNYHKNTRPIKGGKRSPTHYEALTRNLSKVVQGDWCYTRYKDVAIFKVNQSIDEQLIIKASDAILTTSALLKHECKNVYKLSNKFYRYECLASRSGCKFLL